MADVRKMHIVGWGSFPPRGCGVGTFNRDLVYSVMNDERVQGRWSVYPVFNDKINSVVSRGYADYDEFHVRREIYQQDVNSHIEAANDAIERAKKRYEREGIFTGVFGHHEFGLYASDNEGYKKDDFYNPVIEKFRENNIPVITTLHTVEMRVEDKNVERHFDKVMQGVIYNSNKVVCITESVIPEMMKKYDVPRGRLIHIPHGVPENYIPDKKDEIRKEYSVDEKSVLFTSFGHLSRGKGLEYVIEGFAGVLNGPYSYLKPKIFIAGGTHPEVLKRDGEEYRNFLENMAHNLKIRGVVVYEDGSVRDLNRNSIDSTKGSDLIFLNRYLTDEEIPRIIYMSDVGIIGNMNPNQYSSGPGSQWIGLGRPIIATESVFFRGMLENQGVGLLVPFGDSSAYTDRINHYLKLRQKDRDDLAFDASDKGATMTWSIVGQQNLNLMERQMQHNIERDRHIGKN